MADGIKIEIEVHQQAVDRLTDSEESALAKDILTRLNRVERQAKIYLSGVRVNVVTGRLRSSVHSELFRTDDGMIGGRCGTPLDYGRYLNDGTRYIRPRHWLTDAMEEAR